MIYDLQKASLGKRLSAFLFDLVLFVILVTGAAFGLTALLGYDSQVTAYGKTLSAFEEQYTEPLNKEQFDALTEEEQGAYETMVNELNAITSQVFNSTLLIITFSLLAAYLVLEFIIPLILGNGQTLGKKIFGIALMRVDGVRLTPIQLFVRTVLGKYTVETMIPAMFAVTILLGASTLISILAPALILLAQIVLMIITNTNSLIHDKMAGTVAVDMASQLIFDSVEELAEYKRQLHTEEANKADYP